MSGLLERLAALESDVQGLDEGQTGAKGAKGAGNKGNAEKVFGAANIRNGEDPLSSRGISYLKYVGALTGLIDPDHAKLEMQNATVLKKAFGRQGDYKYEKGGVLAPFGCDLFPEEYRNQPVFAEMKALAIAGTAGADQEEMEYYHRKYYQAPGMKNQSWQDQTLGGSLVAPPQQMELIELFRNKDALLNAGARIVPLPPQGRAVYPRQTKACIGYYVGENAPITDSDVKTGALVLSGKKAAALIKTPNELIRFAGPAAEALFRNDMVLTLTLLADKQLLDGQGSDIKPMGLLNTPGVAVVTPTTVAANGNTLAPEDVYTFLSNVAANNAIFEGWVLRPELFYNMAKKRAGSGAGAGTGPFLFDITRAMGAGMPNMLVGFPTTLTPQVSNTRSKGTANNLTYAVGGMWSDFMYGMFGAIEFAATNQGDTSLTNDETWIRAILTHDGGPRHPGAFCVADQITMTV